MLNLPNLIQSPPYTVPSLSDCVLGVVWGGSSSPVGTPTGWECICFSTGRLLLRPGRFLVQHDLGVERASCLARGRPRVLAFVDFSDVGIKDSDASESTSCTYSYSLATFWWRFHYQSPVFGFLYLYYPFLTRGGEINCPCCPSHTFDAPDK